MARNVIAVDARYGLQSPRRGIGEYVYQLMRHLADLPRSYEIRLFGDKTADPGVVAEFRGTYRIDILAAPNFFMWEQWAFPRHAGGCQLLHGTANIGPLPSRVPLVLTIHDVIEWHRGHDFGGAIPLRHHVSRLYRMNALQALSRRARLVFTVSEHAAQDISAVLGVERARLVRTPLAPKYTAQPALWPKERFVLALGAQDPRKNTRILLDVARRLQCWGIGMKIVGMEPRRLGELQGADAGKLDNLEMLGMVDDFQLETLYRQACCFLYPSLYEGFGLPILEAMAAGCPVVTGRNSSLPEVAGGAAALVDSRQAASLAQTCAGIATNPDKQRQMVEKGAQRASEFNWQSTADVTHQGYERVLREIGGGLG